MKHKRMTAAQADSLGIDVDDLGPFGRALVEGNKPTHILVWCWHCGTSYWWPWGRCVYVCERCGGHQIGALQPGEERQ